MPAASGHRSLRALATSAILSFTPLAIGQTTYYVNGACGDDSWTGLSPVCEAPNGPKATIQAGINAADHFDIVEVADGIYRGSGNKNIEFFQKEMSIHSAGGPENCIIDCENDGLGFTFCTQPGDLPVTIEGFTIRNGRHLFAGGICISAAEVTIDNCIIEHCVGMGQGTDITGGGMCVLNSPVIVRRTIIRDNVAESAETGGGLGIYDGSTVVIEESQILRNQVNSLSLFANGGGVHVRSSHIEMSDCSVNDNKAIGEHFVHGGGLFLQGGSKTPSIIEDTEFRRNLVSNPNPVATSGGVYLSGPATMRRCVIAENSAHVTGGLTLNNTADGYLEVDDVQVLDNTADFNTGGAYLEGDGRWDVRSLIIRGNVAGQDGGGLSIGIGGPAGGWQSLDVQNNFAGRDGGGIYARYGIGMSHSGLTGNRAGRDGGAIHAQRGATLSNLLLEDNEAQAAGGGLYLREPLTAPSMHNVTIVGNVSSFGGGVCIDDYGIVESPQMANSIVRGNAPDSIVDNSGMLEVMRSNVEGGWLGVGNLDVDARFADPASGDYHLSAGSPCIDAGNNQLSSGESDLAGLPRRENDPGMPDSGIGAGAIVDMGCYEFHGTSTGFIAVHPRPGVAGRGNELQVAGATPGNVVYFVYGFATGSTGVPGCPGLSIEIANPRLIGRREADSQGEAFIIVPVPPEASGRTIIIQAVEHAACGVSNVVGYRFP